MGCCTERPKSTEALSEINISGRDGMAGKIDGIGIRDEAPSIKNEKSDYGSRRNSDVKET